MIKALRAFLDLFKFNASQLTPPPVIVGLPPVQEIMIPLLVDVFVVTNGVNYDAIYKARRAMDILAEFWADKLGVAVVAHTSGWITKDATAAPRWIHTYEARGKTPSLYFYHGNTVGENNWGEAFNIDGYATVAAGGKSDAIIAMIASQELGHVVGNIRDHQDGTFISDVIDEDNDGVNPNQRVDIRFGAAKLAGMVL